MKMLNEQSHRDIMAIRAYTGLSFNEVETRIDNLRDEDLSSLLTAVQRNNSDELTGDVLLSYNSLRACQDSKTLKSSCPDSAPIREGHTKGNMNNPPDTPRPEPPPPPSRPNVTDLRGQSPLRAFYGVYTAKKNMLDKIEVFIETNPDGTMKKFSFENEDNYIISLRSGDTIHERRLVPVTTSPRRIEWLMNEILAKAEDAIKDAAKEAMQNQMKWADKENADPLADMVKMAEESKASASRMESPESNRYIVGIAARDIKSGEIIEYNPRANTKDILINGSAEISGDDFVTNLFVY